MAFFDFIASVSTADRTCHSRQFATVAASDLIAQDAAENRPCDDTDAARLCFLINGTH